MFIGKNSCMNQYIFISFSVFSSLFSGIQLMNYWKYETAKVYYCEWASITINLYLRELLETVLPIKCFMF